MDACKFIAVFQVVNDTSIITLESVRRLDAGKVVCKAKNGVGTSVTVKTTMLVINRELFSSLSVAHSARGG